ncbi:IclR family transcriptional regulator [Aquamicrobium sp. LC103]|uniref:IclR family transcriptional regulator n=1 Tax=Aquamicrobium sp. LC103 TaxID=1120658 RepID=UPI00063E8562|nr:IclR family transcriptional regulator [Aquamicrobium sp. LC103]TKT74736.1 IclR family transcriptional regulator [Aquamicrobium sp. LC103]
MQKTAAPARAEQADERYRAPALDKGLDILELLSEQPRGLTRGEIVKAMGRGPSEIYRMLERLVARDYVSRSPEGDRYALTMKLFVLAHRHPPVRRLVTRALPLMDAFARGARQSCHLVVPDREQAIVVAQATCPGNWEFGIRVGTEIDLLNTGSGLTLLAFQDPHITRETAARWNDPARSAKLAAFADTFETCRKAGHRIGESRQIRGVEDISAPILTPDGYAIAVLTCPYIQRLDGHPQPDVEEVLALLEDVTQTLSLN